MATIDDLRNSDRYTLIDVRKSPDDRQIPGSLRYRGDALEGAQRLPFERDERVVLYCGSGNSSSRIARSLRERGFENVAVLEGGYAAWVQAGLPLEPISGVIEIES